MICHVNVRSDPEVSYSGKTPTETLETTWIGQLTPINFSEVEKIFKHIQFQVRLSTSEPHSLLQFYFFS